MMNATYSFKCPACGKVEVDNDYQGYVVIIPKNGCRPRTYEICSECLQDMNALMEGRGEKIIEQLETEEHIPTSVWGHHE